MYLWSIPHVSLMYPRTSADTCIPHGSLDPAWIPHGSRMYPDCILIVSWSVVKTRPRYMYRDFVSRCILMYRDEESMKIHVSWWADVSWYVSYALPWCHTGYISRYIRIHVSWTLHQSRYIKIHRDTKSRYTCILDASWRHFKIQSGYIKIHARLIKDTCGINVSAVVRGFTWGTHAGYMYFQDTYIGIRVSQRYLERYVSEMQDTCGIHARYMYLQG